MSSEAPVPAEVVDLADRRAVVRAARDFAEADRLRSMILDRGYLLTDTATGYLLSSRPPFQLHSDVGALPQAEADGSRCTIAMIIDGWPADVLACLEALVAHAPPEVSVLALDCGDVGGAGRAVHAVALQHPGRVVDLHVPQTLGQIGWSRAVTTLLGCVGADVVVLVDPSVLLDGDAISPILEVLKDDTVVGSGWKGVDVDLEDDWRSVVDSGPGEVDAILGYLFAVRRSVGLSTPPHPKARFYRNADLEWSLALRAAGGRLVVPPGDLPVHQGRHRGYHDSDPKVREAESRRNYDRLLRAFRGRTEILAPRP